MSGRSKLGSSACVLPRAADRYYCMPETAERLNRALADRYSIERDIGGMAGALDDAPRRGVIHRDLTTSRASI